MWFTVYMEHSSECSIMRSKAPEDLLSIERYLGSGGDQRGWCISCRQDCEKIQGRHLPDHRRRTRKTCGGAWDQRTYGKRDRCTGRREKKICGRQ